MRGLLSYIGRDTTQDPKTNPRWKLEPPTPQSRALSLIGSLGKGLHQPRAAEQVGRSSGPFYTPTDCRLVGRRNPSGPDTYFVGKSSQGDYVFNSVGTRAPSGPDGPAEVGEVVIQPRKFQIEADNPRIANIGPADVIGINRHAMFGDGSPREVDFARVNLKDLEGNVLKEADEVGGRLNAAIEKGGTRSQRGGICRFSVMLDGAITPGKNGAWTLDGTAIGDPDKQDYPQDSDRGPIAGLLNDTFGAIQDAAGGEDYDITFFGSQKVKVRGVKN